MCPRIVGYTSFLKKRNQMKRDKFELKGKSMDAKFKAMDIANFYIQLIETIPDNNIDNLKLNKLLYYVQGWSLVKRGTPMFSDEIQAWEYGPVVAEVYHSFKCCGRQSIREPLDKFDESRLSNDELDLLINVYMNYGKYTGWALKEMTHKKGGPWESVYAKGKNNVIDLERIKIYFEHESMQMFDIERLNIPVVSEIPMVWDTEDDNVYD